MTGVLSRPKVLSRPNPEAGYDDRMRPARHVTVHALPVLLVALTLGLAACGASGPTVPSATRVPTATATHAPATGPATGPATTVTQAPEPTEVPGGETPGASEPLESPHGPGPTTQTD